MLLLRLPEPANSRRRPPLVHSRFTPHRAGVQALSSSKVRRLLVCSSLQKSKMEGHNDVVERGESSKNVVIEGPGEDQNKSRPISDNIDGVASDELDSLRGGSLKRKYSRPSPNQLQELEAFFRENPRPDQKASIELATKLSMGCNQVKIWFQNRRNQVKLKSEHEENGTLKEENAKLRIEHTALKEAMANPICDRCGCQAVVPDINVDEYQTRLENVRLQDAMKRINALEKEVRRTQDLFGRKL